MDQSSNHDPNAVASDEPTLSVVIQQRLAELSPSVFLVHFDAGVTTTFATDATHPFELAITSGLPPGDDNVAVRTMALSPTAAERFREAMESVSERLNAGLSVWTRLRPSAAFVSDIWASTFDEKLAHRSFGLSTPETLAQSIALKNAQDLGLAQEAAVQKKLQLSQRDHEQRRSRGVESSQGEESEEQTPRRGQSL